MKLLTLVPWTNIITFVLPRSSAVMLCNALKGWNVRHRLSQRGNSHRVCNIIMGATQCLETGVGSLLMSLPTLRANSHDGTAGRMLHLHGTTCRLLPTICAIHFATATVQHKIRCRRLDVTRSFAPV
jgi:hypothetical protein